jgi:uncharacterized protein YijF (DUF1287 family)
MAFVLPLARATRMRKFGFTVLVAVACANPPTEPARSVSEGKSPPVVAKAKANAPVAAVPSPVPPEASLGVSDRGVYADLDAKVQLAAPSEKSLTALVDSRHSLLVVYADGWPSKVYPLAPGTDLESRLRPGDRAELVGRVRETRELAANESPPPGDRDGDGIPDPLDVLIGAKKTVLDGASYDDGYFVLGYPNGDPPRDKGACVDVVVRAARNAGIDIQSELFEDARGALSVYGLSKPDRNIDHRRVRSAIVYFRRHWEARSASYEDTKDPVRPGDVVFLDTFENRPGPDHVGVASDAKGESGHPLLINLWTFGYTTRPMDLLGAVPVTHRFRFPSKR